jgi:hypothetical protein
MHIKYFCWQSLIFPSFQFHTLKTDKEDVRKDWRTIAFRQDHAIQLKKNSYCVFICMRANRGECQHAVCHKCHEKCSKAQKRSQGCVLSEDVLIKSCHHELRNLQICVDMWWCTRDHFGGPQWFDRPKGCAFCEGMFNVGDTWMRMFCGASMFQCSHRQKWLLQCLQFYSMPSLSILLCLIKTHNSVDLDQVNSCKHGREINQQSVLKYIRSLEY